MAGIYVRNSTHMMKTFNLPGTDDKGKPSSLHLTRGEISRPLSQAEYNSPELQKAIRSKQLKVVSAAVALRKNS